MPDPAERIAYLENLQKNTRANVRFWEAASERYRLKGEHLRDLIRRRHDQAAIKDGKTEVAAVLREILEHFPPIMNLPLFFHRIACFFTGHPTIPTGRRGYLLTERWCTRCQGYFVSHVDHGRMLISADADSDRLFEARRNVWQSPESLNP